MSDDVPKKALQFAGSFRYHRRQYPYSSHSIVISPQHTLSVYVSGPNKSQRRYALSDHAEGQTVYLTGTDLLNLANFTERKIRREQPKRPEGS